MSRYKAVIFDYDGVLSRFLRRDPQMYEFVTDLRKQGYVTAALSNQYRFISRVVKHLRHLETFQPCIISCDVGLAKPDPAIFHLMLDKLDLKASECIFIDDRRRNVRAAAKLGITTVRAKNTKQVIKETRALLEQET